jgi:hypothetical protein
MRSTRPVTESSISSTSFAFMRRTDRGTAHLGEREPTPSFTLGVELFAPDLTLDFAHFRAILTRANRCSICGLSQSLGPTIRDHKRDENDRHDDREDEAENASADKPADEKR